MPISMRRVTLLVVLYLALDLANPMMPGAFQFVDGSLEIVTGCPARTADDPMPVAVALPLRLSILPPAPAPLLPAGRRISASPPLPVVFRSPYEPHSAPPSSSDDA